MTWVQCRSLITIQQDANHPMDNGVQENGFFSKVKGAMLGTSLGDFVDGNLPDGIIIVPPG